MEILKAELGDIKNSAPNFKRLFKTMSNIYDGAFLSKIVFWQKFLFLNI